LEENYNMTTMELDAHRIELIRNIMETDNLEKELNARIDEEEAEIDAGIPGYTIEEVHDEMTKKYPWLCK